MWKWETRKVPLTLDASKVQVECLAAEVVKLVEEKYIQDPELISKLLLHATSKSNRTLVHLSAMLGFNELLGNVISHGADLNQPDTLLYIMPHTKDMVNLRSCWWTVAQAWTSWIG